MFSNILGVPLTPQLSLGLFLYIRALINMLNIQEGPSVHLWYSHFMQLFYLVLCSANPNCLDVDMDCWLLLNSRSLVGSPGFSLPISWPQSSLNQLQQLLVSPICFSQRITILCLRFSFLKTIVLSIFSGFFLLLLVQMGK